MLHLKSLQISDVLLTFQTENSAKEFISKFRNLENYPFGVHLISLCILGITIAVPLSPLIEESYLLFQTIQTINIFHESLQTLLVVVLFKTAPRQHIAVLFFSEIWVVKYIYEVPATNQMIKTELQIQRSSSWAPRHTFCTKSLKLTFLIQVKRPKAVP